MKSKKKSSRLSLRIFKKDIHFLLLIGLCTTILLSHTLYCYLTYQHPKWDEHIFLGQAIATYDLIKSPTSSFLTDFSNIYESKPPIYGFVISIPLFLFGTVATYKMALWMNVIFYIGTIIAIYFLGKEFLSKTASLLASMIFAFYGFPLFYLHFVYSETATTTFVVLTLLFLVKSDHFTNRKNSILAGIFFAVGCTTRWVTPIFTIGGILTVLIQSILHAKRKREYNVFLTNSGLFILFSVVLPLLLYYLPNLTYFSNYATNSAREAPEWVESLSYLPKGLSDPFSTHSIMFYFNILSQQTIYFFILFGLGFLISVVKFKKYALFLTSLLIPYLFFTFASVLKDDRYIVPIYPFMALTSAIVFDYIKNSHLKCIIITLTVTLGFLNFIGGSWGLGPLGQQGLKDVVLPEFVRHPRRIYLTTMVWPPISDVTKARTIVKIVDEHNPKQNYAPYLLNTYTVNPLELDVALTSLEQFEKRGVFRAGNLRVINPGDYKDFFSRLMASDFIIIKDTHQPFDDSKYTNYDTDMMIYIFNKAVELENGRIPQTYQEIATIYYPLDKINLKIYKKTPAAKLSDWKPIAKSMQTVDKNHADIIEQVFKED